MWDAPADGLRDHVICAWLPLTTSTGNATFAEGDKLLPPKKDLDSTLQVLL